MMNGQPALKLAIDLLHMPSRVPAIKSAPLPDDVSLLLRIAVGEEQALSTATTTSRCSPETIRKAAAFFIEQILLSQDANSYRILGAKPQATSQELRTNMALLIRWLHPDHDPDRTRAIFISRVTGAWDNLKTEERRTAYDRMLRQQQKPVPRSPGSRKKARQGQRRKTGEKHGQKKNGTGNQRKSPSSPIRKRKNLGIFRQLLLLIFNRTIR